MPSEGHLQRAAPRAIPGGSRLLTLVRGCLALVLAGSGGLVGAVVTGFPSATTASASLVRSSGADPPVTENSSSVIAQPNGAPSVFVTAGDGSLWNYWYVNARWDAAELAAGGVASSPVVVLQADDAPSVFFEGIGGSLWNYWYVSGSWDRAEIAPSGVASAPTAMLQPNGAPSVFVEGTGDSLLNYWYIVSEGTWGAATVAGPGSTYSAPAVISQPTNGAPSVFVEGTGDSLLNYWYIDSEGTWGAATVAGPGSTYSAPAVISQPDGSPSVFVQGLAAVWNYWYASGMWDSSFVALDQPLTLGDSGPGVLALQERLLSLGYWVETDGVFDDSTQQAVWAIQKAAGIDRTGMVDDSTVTALADGVVPQPRSTSGYVIEVDLAEDLVMIVNNGQLVYTFNTSTGGGYIYDGNQIADTPVGHFQIYRAVDGLVVDSLGALWRPRFFTGGYAIHGDSYVPPVPVSHGCVRVSNEAIDFIWSANLAPIGASVWVY